MSLHHASARLLALSFLMTALGVPTAFAQSPTFTRTNYPSLGNNHVVGDWNGDGKLDLAGQGAMSAAILLGNGDGTFQARVEYPVASWNHDLAAGDFNRDGGNLGDANFRVRVINVSSSSSRDYSLDWIAVRVHYQ